MTTFVLLLLLAQAAEVKGGASRSCAVTKWSKSDPPITQIPVTFLTNSAQNTRAGRLKVAKVEKVRIMAESGRIATLSPFWVLPTDNRGVLGRFISKSDGI